MAADQVLVNVSFREIPLFQGAVLHAVSATGAFLHTESPMPVGTMLILSPQRAPELQVPASVDLVVEACRGIKPPAGTALTAVPPGGVNPPGPPRKGELPGMNLVFEASGEHMLDHLEDLSGQIAPAVIAAAPAAPAAVLRRPEPAPAALSSDEIPTKVERRVVASTRSEAPPLQPAASGSLNVENAAAPAVVNEPSVIVNPEPTDPEEPDKVVYELEAEYTGTDGEGEADGEEGEEGEGEGGEGGEGDKPKKKRSRSRRRKKR